VQWYLLLLAALVLVGLSIRNFTKLTGVEGAVIDGTLTLHLTQSRTQACLKKQGLTLWESTRWKDVFDTNGAEEIGNSLTIEYGLLGISKAIWGSARTVSFDGHGTVQPGDSKEQIARTLGPPQHTLQRQDQTLLVYGERRFVFLMERDHFEWFYLSDSAIDLQRI
jgi:hypothetical protein